MRGRKLTDFELLAKLQHHGAATRLIDVSRNMLVALWFTCSSEPEKTGLLFGLAAGVIIGLEGLMEVGAGIITKNFRMQTQMRKISTVCFPSYGNLPLSANGSQRKVRSLYTVQ